MKFGLIDPRARTLTTVEVRDFGDALRTAGIKPGEVDHGTVYRGLGYAIAQYAMFEPATAQAYFSIDRTLYAGSVVLYAFDSEGRSVDYDFGGRWFGQWFSDAAAVEQAIARGEVKRPRLAIGDDVFWQWPSPKPDLDEWARKVAAVTRDQPVQIDDTLIIPVKKT